MSWRPQRTDKQLAEMRGVLDRGLTKSGPAVEPLASIYDLATRQVIGCNETINLTPLTGEFDRGETRRMTILAGTYATFQNGTACLIRLASILEQSVSNELFLASPDSFFTLVGQIVDICEVILARTKSSYRLFADTQNYERLDARVLTISPIKDYRNWKRLYDQRREIMAGRALVLAPPQIKEQPVNLKDKQGWQKAMDDIDQGLDSDPVSAQIAAAQIGDMPLVNGYIENLKILKFSDLEAQSRAKYAYGVQDDSVYERVQLMLYHSVYSVVLDKEGNPAFLANFPYGLVIPKAGMGMDRKMHSPGLYLGTGRLADYQFRVDGKKVQSILFGGIGGFVETLNTFSWEHELHTKLQAYIDFNGFYAVPVIVAPEAFNSGELTISKLYVRMPDIIESTGGYMYAEIRRRLSNLYENYDEILAQLGADMIKNIIIDKVKSWARDYLIKKIGKKFVPLVNTVSAIADLMDDEEIEITRAAIACVIMAVKSTRTDDMTISSKVLAKIGVDKVQARVVEELTKRAGQALRKAHSAVKAKVQPKATKTDAQPVETAPPPEPDPAQAKTTPPTAADDPAIPRGTAGAKTQHQLPTQDDIRKAAQLAEAYRKGQEKAKTAPDHPDAKKQKAGAQSDDDDAAAEAQASKKADPAVDAKATDDKGRDDKATDSKGKDATGTPAPTISKEPPLPPKHPKNAPAKDSLEFFRKNRKEYPPHIQKMIDIEVLKSMRRKPGASKAAVGRINQAVADENAKGKGAYPSIPKDLSSQASLDHLKQHKQDYPPHIRKMIDEEIKTSESRGKSAGKTALEDIDKAIRDDYAQKLSDHWGIPIHEVGRFQTKKGEDTSGSDWEKTNISMRTGKRPTLSATSKTKSGDEVQIDDFDENRRTPRELKSSLEIKNKDPQVAKREIQERMARHAEFAEDYNLPRYEWVAHSKDSEEKMTQALSDLQKQAANHPDPGVRKKLLDRYKKIVIVEELFDE